MDGKGRIKVEIFKKGPEKRFMQLELKKGYYEIDKINHGNNHHNATTTVSDS